jgi:hypothetical protein
MQSASRGPAKAQKRAHPSSAAKAASQSEHSAALSQAPAAIQSILQQPLGATAAALSQALASVPAIALTRESQPNVLSGISAQVTQNILLAQQKLQAQSQLETPEHVLQMLEQKQRQFLQQPQQQLQEQQVPQHQQLQQPHQTLGQQQVLQPGQQLSQCNVSNVSNGLNEAQRVVDLHGATQGEVSMNCTAPAAELTTSSQQLEPPGQEALEGHNTISEAQQETHEDSGVEEPSEIITEPISEPLHARV